MARKKRTRKRKKKGGHASDWNPSPYQRAAMRHGIDVQTYRRYVREYLRENAADGSVNNVQPSQDILDEFIRRRIVEDREEEERERQRRRLAEIRERAYRVRNHLPDNVEPNSATLEQVRIAEARQRRQEEERRRQQDIECRTVYRYIENPDGSIDMGATVASTEEQAMAMEIQAIAQDENISFMDAYRRYNEIYNINTNEIPVTRPNTLRRIRDYFVCLRDRVRERRVFGRRNRTSVVPAAPPQLGGRKRRKRRKRRKKTRRKKGRGNGKGTKRKRPPNTPPTTPTKRPRREETQEEREHREYQEFMAHIEANVDPDTPFQGGRRKRKKKTRRNKKNKR